MDRSDAVRPSAAETAGPTDRFVSRVRSVAHSCCVDRDHWLASTSGNDLSKNQSLVDAGDRIKTIAADRGMPYGRGHKVTVAHTTHRGCNGHASKPPPIPSPTHPESKKTNNRTNAKIVCNVTVCSGSGKKVGTPHTPTPQINPVFAIE